MEQLSHHRPKSSPTVLVEPYLIAAALLLVAFSLLMLYSTTGILSQEKFGDPLFFVKRQGMAAIVGLLMMWFFSRLDIEKLRQVAPILFILSFGLLVLPLIPGLGDSAGGAKRWVKLAFLRFQPGEFVKVFFIIFMAGYFARHEKELKGFWAGVFRPLLLVGMVGVLLLLQPDFGSTVVIATVTLAMGAATGIRIRYLGFAALFMAILMAGLVVLSPYRMARILNFLSPFHDVSGKGYQLIQSLIAVGTGEVTGVGLGESQQKLYFLPAAHTDFLFAVVAEEMGFVGALSILAVFLVILWRGVKIASRYADDTFSFALSVGLTLLIVVPALLNIGVVIGLLPTKGMVLPLMGYGGSSLISCLIVVGLLLAFARQAARHSAV